ncbi:hypothetical protein SAMN05660830_01233 [Halodesulfovibrio aestuarii]|uniref:Uncharacterized protein n=1 Tax=Halodesulfovibrio aestuarii TaxID=126333 RepID=A0A8G2C8R7_9BACT|nr:hypothetical protein SAMN05660830_01233 [Halodesulfovibrio aestuarii]
MYTHTGNKMSGILFMFRGGSLKRGRLVFVVTSVSEYCKKVDDAQYRYDVKVSS